MREGSVPTADINNPKLKCTNIHHCKNVKWIIAQNDKYMFVKISSRMVRLQYESDLNDEPHSQMK